MARDTVLITAVLIVNGMTPRRRPSSPLEFVRPKDGVPCIFKVRIRDFRGSIQPGRILADTRPAPGVCGSTFW